MTKRTTKTTPKACSEECARQYRETANEIHKMLARISKAADTNFDATFGHVKGERIHFGHVGNLHRIKSMLREMSDVVFEEGEYARP